MVSQKIIHCSVTAQLVYCSTLATSMSSSIVLAVQLSDIVTITHMMYRDIKFLLRNKTV